MVKNHTILSQEGDCLMLSRNQTCVAGSYTGGMIFCTHGGTSGFRFSYNPAVPSVFRSNINLEANQLTTTGDITAGTITLAGTDLTTTLNTLSTDISKNVTNIATNTTNISTNTTNISTNASNIATNASNIATNASNIYIWTNNVDAYLTI